ncbi:DUF2829 domain-containing protein [Methylocystis sp. WRRC1]|uniref:Thoeris anti-defense Tad2 family protein n=1 Tax=unclassified Methylocystis TaxID=2625913 RepID=UPI0001F87892|nr:MULTISPECIES: hypothetical protein [unclassified Methylocystis]MCC3246119.1 DUF2829 domain-containing protein [Methylocystis sp. WRRC1]
MRNALRKHEEKLAKAVAEARAELAAAAASGPFGFGRALALLKEGKAVRRRSWEGRTEIFLAGAYPCGGAFRERYYREGSDWRWDRHDDDILAEDWELAP